LKDAVEGPKLVRELDQNFGLEVESYERETTFQMPVKFEGIPDAPVQGNAYYQAWNASLCLPPRAVTVEASRMLLPCFRGWIPDCTSSNQGFLVFTAGLSPGQTG